MGPIGEGHLAAVCSGVPDPRVRPDLTRRSLAAAPKRVGLVWHVGTVGFELPSPAWTAVLSMRAKRVGHSQGTSTHTVTQAHTVRVDMWGIKCVVEAELSNLQVYSCFLARHSPRGCTSGTCGLFVPSSNTIVPVWPSRFSSNFNETVRNPRRLLGRPQNRPGFDNLTPFGGHQLLIR